MIAIPLVAEAFAETRRAKIIGFMMTGGGIRQFVGSLYLRLGRPLWVAL